MLGRQHVDQPMGGYSPSAASLPQRLGGLSDEIGQTKMGTDL